MSMINIRLKMDDTNHAVFLGSVGSICWCSSSAAKSGRNHTANHYDRLAQPFVQYIMPAVPVQAFRTTICS